MRSRKCLPFASTCVHPRFLVLSVLLIFFSFLCFVLFVFILCLMYPMLPVSQFFIELQYLISPVESSNFANAVLYIFDLPLSAGVATQSCAKNWPHAINCTVFAYENSLRPLELNNSLLIRLGLGKLGYSLGESFPGINKIRTNFYIPVT